VCRKCNGEEWQPNRDSNIAVAIVAVVAAKGKRGLK
jgi:hypothetical protein